MTLGRTPAFWVAAATLSTLLFASSAPSPLYVVYQAQFGFSAITLTAVFAVYALALLAALLTLGSISDHLGRRPVLLGALLVEIAAMVVFAEASGVAALVTARVLQGLATGVAMGSLSAALLDLEPDSRPDLGALMGVVAPLSGLALGALATGLLVDHGPAPRALVFWLLLAAFAAAWLAALAMPETVRPDGRWRSSLRPRLGVPSAMRTAFASALPCLAATWALGGLILSLGPSLTTSVFGYDSHLAGGLPIFMMAGVSAAMTALLRNVPARATAQGGLAALIAGIALALVALVASSGALFVAAAAICGFGFGPAFGGIFRVLATLAPEDRKAEVVSTVLAVAYLAFSVPAVLAGVGVEAVGLRATAEIYGVTLIAIAGVALVLSGRIEKRAGTEALVEA
ncbi:MAG: MFS transporter [Thermoleophilaceae bacterium]